MPGTTYETVPTPCDSWTSWFDCETREIRIRAKVIKPYCEDMVDPMRKSRRPVKGELMTDYRMLSQMSKELDLHQKRIKSIMKKFAKTGRSDAMYSLVENLDLISTHMGRARKELNKAGKKLRLV